MKVKDVKVQIVNEGEKVKGIIKGNVTGGLFMQDEIEEEKCLNVGNRMFELGIRHFLKAETSSFSYQVSKVNVSNCYL